MFGESSGGGDGTFLGWLAMAKARGDIDEYSMYGCYSFNDIECVGAGRCMWLNFSLEFIHSL